MQAPITAECARFFRRRNFGSLYIAVTLFSFHWALVLYINSSYIAQFLTDAAIGTIYTVCAAFTIFSFLFISRVLRKVGNFNLSITFTLLELVALIGMASSNSLRTSIPFFMLHQTLVPLILFNLDIYMERFIGTEEGTTGGRRGLFLGLMSFAGAIAPLAAGFLVADDGSSFTLAYVASSIFLVLFLIVMIRSFRRFEDSSYSEIKIFEAIRSFWQIKDLRRVFFAHFTLQLFFAWMVIYVPIYLATVVGFTWPQIGIVLFAGLMAYVFFEYPIGLIADRYLGEKEMMLFGFLIMGMATASFAYLGTASLGVWIFAAFCSRFGASFVETTTESYFFKHTRSDDTHLIGFFRITRPLSYLVGALLGSFTLLYAPLGGVFILLALLMIVGFVNALLLKDTK